MRFLLTLPEPSRPLAKLNEGDILSQKLRAMSHKTSTIMASAICCPGSGYVSHPERLRSGFL